MITSFIQFSDFRQGMGNMPVTNLCVFPTKYDMDIFYGCRVVDVKGQQVKTNQFYPQ